MSWSCCTRWQSVFLLNQTSREPRRREMICCHASLLNESRMLLKNFHSCATLLLRPEVGIRDRTNNLD